MFVSHGNTSPYQDYSQHFGYDHEYAGNIDQSVIDDMIDPELLNDPDTGRPVDAWQPRLNDGEFGIGDKSPSSMLYPSAASVSTSMITPQQALYSYRQQIAPIETSQERIRQSHTTISPSQLFNAASTKAVQKEVKPRTTVKPAKSVATVKREITPQPTTKSKPLSIKHQKPDLSFDYIQKEFLSGDTKYGWHGRFDGSRDTPIDKLTSFISPQTIGSIQLTDSSTDIAEHKIGPPSVRLDPLQLAVLCQGLVKGMPSAYVRAWKTHQGGLRMFALYLKEANQGLLEDPSGPWLAATQALLKLVRKVLPSMQDMGYYQLGNPISQLIKNKKLDKSLRALAKEVKVAISNAEQEEAPVNSASKRSSTDMADASTNVSKRTKVEKADIPAPPRQTTAGSSRTVVKAAPSKSNNTDMSAFGMTGPLTKVKRPAHDIGKDAITSLLSGLNPAAIQSNVKAESIPVDRPITSKSGKTGPIKRVSFAPDDKLVQFREIESRGEEGQPQNFNLLDLKGEGKIMRQHGHLEEQQTWYSPSEIDVIESKTQTCTDTPDQPYDGATTSSPRLQTPTEHDVQDVDGTSDIVRQILPWNNTTAVVHVENTSSEPLPTLPFKPDTMMGFGVHDASLQVQPIPALSGNALSNLLSALAPKPMAQSHVSTPSLPFPVPNYAQTYSQPQHINSGFTYQPPFVHENGWQQSSDHMMQTQYQDHHFGQRQSRPAHGSRPKQCYDFLNKGVCLRDNCTYQH